MNRLRTEHRRATGRLSRRARRPVAILAFAAIFIAACAVPRLRADDAKLSAAAKPADDSKAASLTSRVTDEAGKPVSKATVVMAVGPCQVYLPAGDVTGIRFRAKVVTDEAGRFRFLAANGPLLIAVLHPIGYAQVRCTRQSVPESIKLAPWARAEGTYRIARKPVANVSIEVSHDGTNIGVPNGPWVIWMDSAITDANGRFVFERTLPGPTSIGRKLNFTLNEGFTEVASSSKIHVLLTAGQTTGVEFAFSGRPVIGQLRHAADLKQVTPWNFADIDVEPLVPLFNKPSFEATADREGNFSIDGVPPGEYVLKAAVRSKNPIELASERLVSRFTVPEISEKLSQRPVDLGVLTLESTGVRRGKVARARK
jgi:hypothetical protein